jgi:hypothetical protein
MMKRLTWFAGGVVAGAIGAGQAKRKVKAVASELTPVQVARRASDRVRRRGHDVAEAVREGRRAMRLKEVELRARVDGRVTTLADELDDDAEVLVDGRPVEPGQVIVLRQVRDGGRGGSPRTRRRA